MNNFDARYACDSRNPRLTFTRFARYGCYARNKNIARNVRNARIARYGRYTRN